jgi:uncharacterized protein (UPF0297 family)
MSTITVFENKNLFVEDIRDSFVCIYTKMYESNYEVVMELCLGIAKLRQYIPKVDDARTLLSLLHSCELVIVLINSRAMQLQTTKRRSIKQ